MPFRRFKAAERADEGVGPAGCGGASARYFQCEFAGECVGMCGVPRDSHGFSRTKSRTERCRAGSLKAAGQAH